MRHRPCAVLSFRGRRLCPAQGRRAPDGRRRGRRPRAPSRSRRPGPGCSGGRRERAGSGYWPSSRSTPWRGSRRSSTSCTALQARRFQYQGSLFGTPLRVVPLYRPMVRPHAAPATSCCSAPLPWARWSWRSTPSARGAAGSHLGLRRPRSTPGEPCPRSASPTRWPPTSCSPRRPPRGSGSGRRTVARSPRAPGGGAGPDARRARRDLQPGRRHRTARRCDRPRVVAASAGPPSGTSSGAGARRLRHRRAGHGLGVSAGPGRRCLPVGPGAPRRRGHVAATARRAVGHSPAHIAADHPLFGTGQETYSHLLPLPRRGTLPGTGRAIPGRRAGESAQRLSRSRRGRRDPRPPRVRGA